MSFGTKIAVILVCAAICASGILLLPRESERRERTFNNDATPVLLQKSRPVHWLLV